MDTDLRRLVAELEDLSAIFRVQGTILARGRETVPALAAFLLGRPSPLPQARVAAAECLGALGGDEATAALIDVLTHHDVAILSPAVRLAEQTVRNAAARALGKLGERRAVPALLAALGEQRLVGAGAALALMRETRAIPGLLRLFEESTYSEAAEVLASFGRDAVPALCEALNMPMSSPAACETPGSEQRRALAAELIGRLRGNEDAGALRCHLDDVSSRVRRSCAIALTRMGILDARALAVLGEALDDPDCVVQDDAVAMLTAAGATAVSALASVLIDPGRSWRARSLAATLLGRNGGDEVVAALLRGLGAEHPQIRQSAVRALGRFRDEPLVACALRHARRDVALAVRDAAREVLRQG